MELNERHPWLQNPSVRSGGLTDRQIDLALGEYAAREMARPELGNLRGKSWKAWLDDVLRTRVEILPAARAVLRDERSGLAIALRFTPTGKRKGREPYVTLDRVEIASSATPPAVDPASIDPSVFYAAFLIELERIGSGKSSGRARRFFDVTDRPEPGKAPKTAYYAAILAEVEALSAEGHAAPEKEVALRYGVNRSTFRWQIRKARELRAKREQEGRP
jgi:hypothetical protein